MNPAQTLAEKMAEKPDQHLHDMLARPADWTPEALDAAKKELERRGIENRSIPVPDAAPPPLPIPDCELTPSGRKRFLKATTTDIVISLILPGWGVIVGFIALLKGESRRAATMIAIGICVFVAIAALKNIR